MGTLYAAFTPYIIPPRLAGRKAANVGDGFILHAIERFLGRFPKRLVYTSRDKPGLEAIAELAACDAVVLAGANQLSDNFTIWPEAELDELKQLDIRFVPFGIGLHGEPGFNNRMSDNARAQIRFIHERIEFSSWRCPNTVTYLEENLPDLKGRFLMTGCPVVFDAPLLEGDAFHDGHDTVAVTVTERGNFWDRELSTLERVSTLFPKSRRLLVLHQDFEGMNADEAAMQQAGDFDPTPHSAGDLRRRARQLGYEVVAPGCAEDTCALYRNVDIHIGSRLHAHLLFLSKAKRTWLIPVDRRATGMAECIGFPLVSPETIEKNLAFDFEKVRDKARETFDTMGRFLRSLPR